jgi:hypothetical protein
MLPEVRLGLTTVLADDDFVVAVDRVVLDTIAVRQMANQLARVAVLINKVAMHPHHNYGLGWRIAVATEP